MMADNQDYIGDGVYVEYDGYGFWLKANDHKNPTDKIHLEPNVLWELMHFASRYYNFTFEKGKK